MDTEIQQHTVAGGAYAQEIIVEVTTAHNMSIGLSDHHQRHRGI